MIAADVGDYRRLAQRRLPNFLFQYIDGGSYSESTMRRNTEDLGRILLRQQVMHDVSRIDLGTTLLGRPSALPIALAPIGLAGMYARRGEVQAARAAEAAGVPFILSSSACCSLEEVSRGVSQPVVLQLYMIRDREFMKDFLARTVAAGVETLILTVDLPVHSARYRDVRTGLTGAQGLRTRLARFFDIARHPDWAWDVGLNGGPHTLGNFAAAMPGGAGLAQFTAWVSKNFDASVTWKDIDWIRTYWPGRLVVKGVLDPANARAAVDAGAEAVVVSNHGGRQLDGAPSSISALPGVVEAVGDRADVLMDGGVRTGVDVLRALALGAKGVLIGRAWAFALAARGGAGVAHVLELFEHEMRVAMALTGQTDVTRLNRDMLANTDGWLRGA